MPGPTAQQLIRGLGTRMREFFISTPSGGTQATLIDAGMRQFMPKDINQLNAWVTCVAGDGLNLGVERRASAWAQGVTTVTFYPPGFPANVGAAAGIYEFHMRFQRALLLEAINDASGQLGLTWYREVKDESLTTVAQQWRYTLPNSQHWTTISKIEIQINTDPQAVAGGYPYAPADYLNGRVDRSVDIGGNELWEIQFGLQPPPGRKLRVWGESYYSDLVADSDFLPLAGEWTRPAMTWIYSMAMFNLNDWTTNQAPTSETAKIRQQALDQLERQKNQLLATAPAHKPGKIVTPGRGDGYAVESPDDYRYLGAFKSSTFVRGGG